VKIYEMVHKKDQGLTSSDHIVKEVACLGTKEKASSHCIGCIKKKGVQDSLPPCNTFGAAPG
jgi:hypothetical protein